MKRTVLWHSAALPSMERSTFEFDRNGGGFTIQGTVLTLLGDDPAEIRYVTTCNSEGLTCACAVEILAGEGIRSFRIHVSERGQWIVNGVEAPELSGVNDVDLSFSPCSNTLPVRRLNLPVGEKACIASAWLRFPELDIVRAEQIYTRLSEERYRFETGTGDFRAELIIDDHGIVTTYGDLWQSITPRNAER
jgi:hypothetical protein